MLVNSARSVEVATELLMRLKWPIGDVYDLFIKVLLFLIENTYNYIIRHWYHCLLFHFVAKFLSS